MQLNNLTEFMDIKLGDLVFSGLGFLTLHVRVGVLISIGEH